MYLINPNTAEVRAICPPEIDTTALTFTSDGVLIIGVDRALYTFDVVDCSLSILVSILNMKLQEISLDCLMAIYGQFEEII